MCFGGELVAKFLVADVELVSNRTQFAPIRQEYVSALVMAVAAIARVLDDLRCGNGNW